MRIGIDLDDTICRTTEIVHDRVEKYAKEKNLNPLDIINDEALKQEFFTKNLKDIYQNVEVKRNVVQVLKRLRSKGNEIYIITARSNHFVSSITDVVGITKSWLEKKKIIVDNIISSAYGETKAEVCKQYNIDLMIDDDPYNYKMITSLNKKCLLFDDRGKYNMKQDYVTNWLEIEKYIERNR